MLKHKAHSRRLMSLIDQKVKILKRSSFILAVLLMVYFTSKLAANLAVFHPVQSLASADFEVKYIDHKVEVIKEVEVDRKFKSEKQQVLAYLVEKFGDRAGDAITIINQCENHAFNPKAINHNRNGSVDIGIMQINVDSTNTAEVEKLYDWKYNIDRGYKKYVARGNKFTDWTCATVIGEKNYLGQ